jgi:dTDP-4-amino-4,6-dideoxygalactose transaminase
MIAMTGFPAEPQALRDAQVAAAAAVIDSHHYVLGPQVDRFEAAWAAASGSRRCVGVANGLDAIEISLRCLGIGPGDEVVTTSMTAFATVLAILRAGATPVLADIDAGTALLSRESVERCLSDRTRAVLLVHLYGQARAVASWSEWCAARGLVLLEDCAQSHLARSDDRPAGTFGPMAAYSFYPTKNLGALGDGGAITFREADHAARAKRLRNGGQTDRYHHDEFGVNTRLDEMQAAVLRARLRYLPGWTERRRALARRYRQHLDGVSDICVPSEFDAGHVYHLFPVLSERRDELRARLSADGIETLIHYPVPIPRQPALASERPAPCPIADRVTRQVFSLPLYPAMADTDVERVADALRHG